ncbi:MAG: hypothetical protein EOP50_07065 [Sphingobacteriales bacterium]|nr:MAG: hypothetical protein EOP50_07065 [Sphingobacteriales bacterium]
MKKLLCAGLLLAFIGCKKSDSTTTENNSINTTTPTEAQVMGTYKQTAETRNGQNSWTTANGMHQACDMDDTYTFGTNNILTRTDAGTTCNPSYGGTSGWTLTGSTLRYYDGVDYTITSFDGTTLKLRWQGNSRGVQLVLEKTLVRQ